MVGDQGTLGLSPNDVLDRKRIGTSATFFMGEIIMSVKIRTRRRIVFILDSGKVSAPAIQTYDFHYDSTSRGEATIQWESGQKCIIYGDDENIVWKYAN